MSWLSPPTGPAAAQMAAIAGAIPVLTAERLTLRAPRLADWPAYRDVLMSDRAQFMDGPFTEEAAFADFCQGVAGWMLRGSGMWTITLAGDDAPLGWLYLWQEKDDPEPEMGWVLTEAAEGKGYASEAALAVLPLAIDLFGPGGFVSYIDAGNEASARLALRLGAVRDLAAEAAMSIPELHIYRHATGQRLGYLVGEAPSFQERKTHGRRMEDTCKTSEKGE